MVVFRYINGQKLESQSMKNYVIESDMISRAIAGVNQRMTEISTRDVSKEITVEII